MPQDPHAAVTRAWAEHFDAIRRLFVIPFDGDEAGLDDPEDEALVTPPSAMCDDVAILTEPFAELSCELPDGHDGDHKGFLMTQRKRRAFLHWQTVD